MVLPNFLKALLITSAFLFSISVAAGSPEVRELKDLSVEETTILKGDASEDSAAKEQAKAEAEERMEKELKKIPTE